MAPLAQRGRLGQGCTTGYQNTEPRREERDMLDQVNRRHPKRELKQRRQMPAQEDDRAK